MQVLVLASQEKECICVYAPTSSARAVLLPGLVAADSPAEGVECGWGLARSPPQPRVTSLAPALSLCLWGLGGQRLEWA